MTKTSETHGSWKRGETQIRASYLDEAHTRVDYQNGESQVLTNGEWVARWEMMREVGLERA